MLSAFTVIPNPPTTSNVGSIVLVPLCVIPSPAVTDVTVPEPADIATSVMPVILPCWSTVT